MRKEDRDREIEVRVRLIALGQPLVKYETTLTKKTTYGEYMNAILSWINLDAEVTLGNYHLLQPFFEEYFGADRQEWKTHKYIDDRTKDLNNVSPYCQIQWESHFWLAIHLNGFNPAYAFSDSIDGDFEFVETPEHYQFLSSDNSILDKETGVVFKPGSAAYPWTIKFPGRYDHIALLERLLERYDENPLTILLNSPQPYKGLGAQLKDELKHIYQAAVEAIDVSDLNNDDDSD